MTTAVNHTLLSTILLDYKDHISIIRGYNGGQYRFVEFMINNMYGTILYDITRQDEPEIRIAEKGSVTEFISIEDFKALLSKVKFNTDFIKKL